MPEPLCCIVGCYDLDLYCALDDEDAPWHEYRDFPANFTGRGFRDTAAKAKEAGWAVHPRRSPPIAICPRCRQQGIGVMTVVRMQKDAQDA